MTWTDQRIEQLTTLWTEGRSAAAIAAELGAVTRNAVIGKIHRLGLAARARTSQGRQSVRRTATARRPRRRAQPIQHPRRPIAPIKIASMPVEPGPAPEIPVTIATLTEHTCRWPEGDPQIPGFHFCGRWKSSPSGPYCEPHAAIAYL